MSYPDYTRVSPWRVATCFAMIAVGATALAVLITSGYTGLNFILGLVSCW